MIGKIKKYFTVKLKSSKLMIALSLATLAILILATITIMTIISKTPIIILALGEAQAGQMDLVLHSAKGNGGLNNTRIQELIGMQGMPRISISSLSVNGIGGTAWMMDFQKENRNKLGRFGFQIAQNEVFLHQSYKLPTGKQVLIQWFSSYQLYYIVYEQIKNYANTTEEIKMLKDDLIRIQNARSLVPFKVAGTFGVSMGKFKEGATPFFAYFNIKNILPYIFNYVSQNITLNNSTLMSSFISSLKMSQASQRIVINIPERNKVYENPNYDQTALVLNAFGTDVINKVGIYAVDTEMPILYQISRMSYFGMFIGVILKLIIVSLFTLSVLMMYNTMMIGVQTRNFDFGMLRTVGMSKVVLVGTVLVDSLKYVLVANLFAYPISFLCLRLASSIFQDFFGYNYRLYPTTDSILVASVVGFLVPIVSSFIPIQVALGEKIVESINPIRNKTIGLKTEVYVQGREFPWSRFIFGFIACVFGVMIYYFLPQSLINENIGMLLSIFFSLLIGLLVGLVLLSYSFHYIIQKIVAYVTLFWVNRTNFSILLKNLSAHRVKNRRASLLYSLSISFIVFVSVGISIQIQSIYNELLKSHGCYLQVSGYINKSYYDRLLRTEPFSSYIQDFSYQTRSVYEYLQQHEGVVKIQASDKARLFFNTHQIYGVSPNFLDTLYNQKFDIKDTLSNKGLDPVEFLYTKAGSGTTIISEYMSNSLGLNLKNSREYLLTISTKTTARRLKLNISSIFSKSAGLGFSSFEFLPSEIGISLPTFAEICNIKNYDNIPYKRIIIKLFDPKKSTELANEIRREISSKNADSVWDYAELTQTITNIETLLKKIFLILLLVVLLISFFSLLSTTSTNIMNQTKQISILLGLGLQKHNITLIYIYEAFILVFTACLIGIFVGGIVAYTMGLQRQLFGDFDITIDISGIWIIMIAAILSAIASTYGPIKRVLKQRVADIMKMV